MAVQHTSPKGTAGAAQRSWSGAPRQDLAPPAPQRQWEGGAAPGIDRYFRSARRRWKLRILLFLLLAIVLTVGYLVLLLHFPQRTPLVVAAVQDYAWPVAPNAWAREDVAGLRRLDGQTVELMDTSLGWRSRQHVLAEWQRSLEKVASRRSQTNSAVFYLSIHGLVDAEGAPCLLPPGASPLERDQWVAVEELLQRMRDILPADLNKLLVLDCTRQLDNWNAAIVHNTFAQRVAELVERRQVPNLLLLNATSAGEAAWASPDLRGTIFGRSVLLGLAGAADRGVTSPPSPSDTSSDVSGVVSGEKPSDSPNRPTAGASRATASTVSSDRSTAATASTYYRGGNGDGRVTARELQSYVTAEVARWSAQQRNITQTPRLSPVDADDFVVAWNVSRRTLSKLERELAAVTRAPDSVSEDEIHSLWSSWDALRPLELNRVDPIAARDIEHQLVWLERLSTSGEGYADAAERLYQDLRQRLEQAVKRAVVVQARPTLASQLAVFHETRNPWPRTLPLASLRLSEQLGVLEPAQAAALESAMRTSALSDAEPLPSDAEVPREKSERLSDVRFQFITRWYHVNTLWNDANLVRDFVDARLKLENVAAQHDPRAHARLRLALDAADAARRSAEDQLLAGETAASQTPIAVLQAAYDDLAGRDDAPLATWQRAWSVRDRALDELPFWAQWLATSQQESDPILERFPKLVASTHQLNDFLDSFTAAEADVTQEVINLANELQGELDALRDEFAEHCAEMEMEALPTGLTYRRIDQALRSSSLAATQRLALRRALTRCSTKLHDAALQQAASATAAPVSGSSNTASGNAPLPKPADELLAATLVEQRVASWRVHPLMRVLWSPTELAELQPSDEDDFAVAGTEEFWQLMERTSQRLRTRLRDIQSASRGQVNASNEDLGATNSSPARPDPERRAKLAERNARLAAALWLPVSSEDAIQSRRRRDLQRVLVWFAQRTLDDCYGSGPRDPLVPVPPAPYFERAVQDYLLAVTLLAPIDASIKQESDRIQAQLSTRVLAMKSWANLRAIRRDAPANSEMLDYEVLVTPRESSDAGTSANGTSANGTSTDGKNADGTRAESQLPTGRAIVFLRSSRREAMGQRASLPLPLTAEARAILAVSSASAQDAGLEAVLVFRGHEIAEPVDDRLTSGIVVEAQPIRTSEAQVTVIGDRKQRSSIVFILDCSGSMGNEIPVEAAGPATLPRLDLARASLTALLDQLALRGDARVGVRFFGHRVGFSLEKPIKRVRQEAYPDPIPDELHPDADIERFLPLGRFDSVEAGKVAQRVQLLQPWGQSPIYRALLEAHRDFEGEPDDSNLSVVVITDGENYRFEGTDPSLKAPPAVSVNEVEAAYAASQIPIFILGFGINPTENANAEREFQRLASQTRGAYFSIQNGADLLKTLRSRLGAGTYAVLDTQGQVVSRPEEGEPAVRLNVPVTLGNLGSTPQPFTVRFESAQAPIQLEGGEAIVLRTSSDGRDLWAIPYDQGLPVFDTLSTTGRKERLTVRAHRPALEGRTARFRVSLQDEDLRFTPRPAEVWIEIKPLSLDDDVAPPPYVFYDRVFLPKEPVPVVECVANQWPAAARQAEVRVWCKPTPTPAVQDLPLADVLSDRERFAQPQVISGIDGLRFVCSIHETPGTNAPWEVRVVTQLAQEGSDIAHLRVLWEGADDTPPQRVVHRYEVSRRQAIHSFWFPAATSPKAVAQGQGRIAFTHRAAIRDGAFRTPNERPLVVDVTSTNDTLPLDAATGNRGR